MLKQLDREPGSDRRHFGCFGTACYYTLILKPGILVVGALVMDLVATTDRYPEPGETVRGTGFRTYPGGKGANQAAAAVRMGARVEMVGRAGGDAFGQQLVDSLRDAGVGVSGVTIRSSQQFWDLPDRYRCLGSKPYRTGLRCQLGVRGIGGDSWESGPPPNLLPYASA